MAGATSGGGFHAQIDQIGSSGRRVQELSQEIRGLLSQIEAAVGGLGSGWKGSDATTFTTLSTTILEDCVPINNVLDVIGEHLGTTSTNYATDVQHNVAVASKLRQYTDS